MEIIKFTRANVQRRIIVISWEFSSISIIVKYFEASNNSLTRPPSMCISISSCMRRESVFTRFAFASNYQHKITFTVVFSDIPIDFVSINRETEGCQGKPFIPFAILGESGEERERNVVRMRWQKFCSNTLRNVLLRRRCTRVHAFDPECGYTYANR